MRQILALLLYAIAPAGADENARAFFETATAQFALGKFAEAAGNFEKCFELKPDPAILYNAAQARRLSGNKPRALELYTSYLRIYGERIDNRAEVLRHIENLRAAIAKDRQVASSPPITTKPPPAVDEPAPPRQSPPIAVAPLVPPPTLAPSTVEPSADLKSRPASLVRKGWFWGVIAGAAALAATGIALGVVYGTPAAKDPNPSFGSARGN